MAQWSGKDVWKSALTECGDLFAAGALLSQLHTLLVYRLDTLMSTVSNTYTMSSIIQ